MNANLVKGKVDDPYRMTRRQKLIFWTILSILPIEGFLVIYGFCYRGWELPF